MYILAIFQGHNEIICWLGLRRLESLVHLKLKSISGASEARSSATCLTPVWTLESKSPFGLSSCFVSAWAKNPNEEWGPILEIFWFGELMRRKVKISQDALPSIHSPTSRGCHKTHSIICCLRDLLFMTAMADKLSRFWRQAHCSRKKETWSTHSAQPR